MAGQGVGDVIGMFVNALGKVLQVAIDNVFFVIAFFVAVWLVGRYWDKIGDWMQEFGFFVLDMMLGVVDWVKGKKNKKYINEEPLEKE